MGSLTGGHSTGSVAESLHVKHKLEGETGPDLGFGNFKAHYQWHTFQGHASKSFPEQFCQLGIKHSNIYALRGSFSFTPPQCDPVSLEEESGVQESVRPGSG